MSGVREGANFALRPVADIQDSPHSAPCPQRQTSPNIASLSLDAVLATGEKFVLELAIGAPFISERHQTWACSLTLHPIFSEPQEVAAADSLQALSLALRVARSLLEDFSDNGGKLLLDGEEFPINAWLGSKL